MNLDQLYDKFLNWIVSTGPKVLAAIVILVLGFWLIRLFKSRLRKILQKRTLDKSLLPFLLNVAATVLQVFLLITAMQVVGVRMTLLTAVIGALGVAAGLALSGTLQNFTSGVLILLFKPFKIGDNIVAQGQDGIVSSIQLFYTVVITADNRTAIIPNSKLSNEVIVNITRQQKRRLDIEIKFNYGVDSQKVREVIQHSLESAEYVLKDPAPQIGVSLVEVDGYRVMTNVWVNPGEYERSKLQLQEKLISNLKAGGIKLPGMP